jgi:hypothetical protein
MRHRHRGQRHAPELRLRHQRRTSPESAPPAWRDCRSGLLLQVPAPSGTAGRHARPAPLQGRGASADTPGRLGSRRHEVRLSRASCRTAAADEVGVPLPSAVWSTGAGAARRAGYSVCPSCGGRQGQAGSWRVTSSRSDPVAEAEPACRGGGPVARWPGLGVARRHSAAASSGGRHDGWVEDGWRGAACDRGPSRRRCGAVRRTGRRSMRQARCGLQSGPHQPVLTPDWIRVRQESAGCLAKQLATPVTRLVPGSAGLPVPAGGSW